MKNPASVVHVDVGPVRENELEYERKIEESVAGPKRENILRLQVLCLEIATALCTRRRIETWAACQVSC